MIIKKEDFGIDFHVYRVDEIESTNTYLKSEYNKYEDKMVLIADKQTKGRGRYNRVWVSDNDIIFSILLKENNAYSIIAPLSIVLALKKYNIEAGIKWPNDIYINSKKLAGILIEDIFDDKFEASIIGIGMNMTDKGDVNGIGLNIDIDKSLLIKTILNTFNELLTLDFNDLIVYYKMYSIVIGKYVEYQDKLYKAVSITKEGHLVLERNDKKISIRSDEINIKDALR